MRYGSVCSGIEAATVAWHPLGWTPAFFSEIEAFPCEVLRHHYPRVANLGDMTNFKEWPDADLDVLVGGTPCQSFSHAGLRQGLRDPRGNLMLTYGAIAARYRPRWLLWENVPGVLSTDEGRDFGAFLGMLGELGYGFAYRVLDAQYFGLAQRRKRVFVVGCLGDWRAPAAVLLEPGCLRGDPAPRREAGEDIAPTIAGSSNGGGANGPGRDVDSCESLIPIAYDIRNVTNPTDRANPQPGAPCHTLHRPEESVVIGFNWKNGAGFGAANDGLGIVEDGTGPLQAGHMQPAVAFKASHYTRDKDGAPAPIVPPLTADTDKGDQDTLVLSHTVRRLTPRECERLQGFPDDYTAIPRRGKLAADAPRYRALGNSMAVPVMRWIGERIQLVDDILKAS